MLPSLGGRTLIPGEGVDDESVIGVAGPRLGFQVGIEHCHNGTVPFGRRPAVYVEFGVEGGVKARGLPTFGIVFR